MVVGEDDGAAGESTRRALLVALRSGDAWPDPSRGSVVTVLLEPREGGQTLMTIRHTLLPAGLADQHARGWEAIAGQLAAELSVTAAGAQSRYRSRHPAGRDVGPGPPG